MLETPHVVVGAAIASTIPNPLISIPLAFASHFVLDKVPHWNPHLNTEMKKFGKVTNKSKSIVAFDVALSIVLGGTISYLALPNTAHALTILAAGFVAVLPDVIEGPYFFLNMKNKFIDRWMAFKKSIQNDTKPVPGISIQVATVIASFWWVLR